MPPPPRDPARPPRPADPADLRDEAPHVTPQGLATRTLGELVLRVAAELERAIAAAGEAEQLTPIESRTLRYLREGAPQGKLTALLGCDAARVSHTVSRLVERGLVERRPGADRRVRHVSLTPAGRAVVDRIGLRLSTTSPLVGCFDDGEHATLFALLGRVDARSRPAPKARP